MSGDIIVIILHKSFESFCSDQGQVDKDHTWVWGLYINVPTFLHRAHAE